MNALEKTYNAPIKVVVRDGVPMTIAEFREREPDFWAQIPENIQFELIELEEKGLDDVRKLFFFSKPPTAPTPEAA